MPLDTDAAPLLERLRRATQLAHDNIDTLAKVHDYCAPEGYGRLLTAQCAAVLPLERLLEAKGAPDILPDWRERTRGVAIAADLADLGLTPVEDDCPGFEGDAELLGALYVLEGTRLGGRYIAARLQQSAPETPLPTRFLRHGQGKPLWPAFIDALERTSLTEAECERAQEAACRAFSFFRTALERHYV